MGSLLDPVLGRPCPVLPAEGWLFRRHGGLLVLSAEHSSGTAGWCISGEVLTCGRKLESCPPSACADLGPAEQGLPSRRASFGCREHSCGLFPGGSGNSAASTFGGGRNGRDWATTEHGSVKTGPRKFSATPQLRALRRNFLGPLCTSCIDSDRCHLLTWVAR